MYSIDYTDPGTPAVPASELVTVEIDGESVTVPAGTSIMRAAATLERNIPKLCATGTLKAFGSCRVCLVEIEGRKGFPASCTTTVAPGMKVRTQSEAITRLRKNVVELYVSDHPTGWNEKAGTGASEFDVVAKSVGLTENRFGIEGRNHVK